MSRPLPILAQVLADPARMLELTLAEWDLVVRQGRRADLLARLWVLLEEISPHTDGALSPPKQHLRSSYRVAAKQAQVVRYEVEQIRQALASIDQPLILLKGAAYVMAVLPPAKGRIFSDIDILVPKEKIEQVEQVMIRNEWESAHHDEYDQHYYRAWMHELPPMRHLLRRTVIDIHHSILPETARLHPDPKKLLREIQPLPGFENIYTLSNVDMVLHSATHLFHEGELEHGLRDLVDLDALLRHFGTDNAFWERLVERAVELDLIRPLYYALRYTQQMLQTPAPPFTVKAAATLGRPPAVLSWLMDALFERALLPDHSSCDDAFTPLARWMLYIRSHYLRMPFHLLIPHLIRKAIKNRMSSAPLAGPAVEKP
jgi:Uncharacterised nucleotidyltransferase